MKPKIVLSGVNLRQSGTLVIFREALTSLQRLHGDNFEIVALVKSRELFNTPGVTYIEFPHIVKSWFARLRFEYWTAPRIRPRKWEAGRNQRSAGWMQRSSRAPRRFEDAAQIFPVATVVERYGEPFHL